MVYAPDWVTGKEDGGSQLFSGMVPGENCVSVASKCCRVEVRGREKWESCGVLSREGILVLVFRFELKPPGLVLSCSLS